MNAFKYGAVVGLMVDRRAAPAQQAARARRSLGRWTGALIGLAAFVRSAVGLMSFFAIGPLSGLAAYPLWDALGNGPIVAEWLVAGLLVVAGIVIAMRVRSTWTYRQARLAGWFVVIDTVLYDASITVVLVVELDAHQDLWWRMLAAVMIANTALVAMGVAVIRKASSTGRIQRNLLRGLYVRKRRLARIGMDS